MAHDASVAVFLAQVVTLLVFGRLMGELMQRIGQPAVMGQLIAGILLGGQFGIGTILFALLIGPMVGVTLPLLRVPETSHEEAAPEESATEERATGEEATS